MGSFFKNDLIINDKNTVSQISIRNSILKTQVHKYFIIHVKYKINLFNNDLKERIRVIALFF